MYYKRQGTIMNIYWKEETAVSTTSLLSCKQENKHIARKSEFACILWQKYQNWFNWLNWNKNDFVTNDAKNFRKRRLIYQKYFEYCNYRSSRKKLFLKKLVLKISKKLTGKHLCQSLFFNKVAYLRPATLLRKRLWCRCILSDDCFCN